MTGAIDEMQRAIGRVEGKIDTMLEQMRAHDDRTTDLDARMREGYAELDGRQRKVENNQYRLATIGSGAGMLIGGFLSFLTGHGFKLPP